MAALATPRDLQARRRDGLARRRALAASGAAPDRRLTVLGSFNLDPLPPFAIEALDRHGLTAEVSTGEFGQLVQPLLDPTSPLLTGEPRDVVLVPAVEDLLAPLFAGELDAERCLGLVADRLAELEAAIGSLLERQPAATCYVVVFGSARAPVEHVLDPVASHRGQEPVARFLDGVRGLGALSARVVVVDWEHHARAAGADALSDDRLWYLGRMRLSPLGTAVLAELLARHVAAFEQRARKVLAVDLDDTLWGGVLGEVGLGGLELGGEGLGLAFQDVQRELRTLRSCGVVLALCSKNDSAAVVEAFRRAPGMELTLEDFTAQRINWQDKATNLREIATELSLGLDSFVFLDDNPVEREWIRQALPMVAVPDLPEDPARRPAFLRAVPHFQRIGLTDFDTRRAEAYATQGRRSRLREDSATLESFLASLEQEAVLAPVDEASLGRAAQLCQRTNQFNLTNRRHTPADVERMLASTEFDLHTLAVTDRFGDSGITGLLILRSDGDRAELDTFLLSCRVLGRRIEDALLACAAERARARGAGVLAGRYVPTERNGQVAAFLEDRGIARDEDGGFAVDLNEHRPAFPAQVRVRVVAGA